MIRLKFGDGAFPELLDKLRAGQVIQLRADTTPLEVGLLNAGMTSGAHSVALVFDLPDGRTVFYELSAKEFLAAAAGVQGRIAFETPKPGGIPS